MKTPRFLAFLLLATSPFFLNGCLGTLFGMAARNVAQGSAVNSATLGQQPGMVQTARQSAEAVRIMSANTSAQGAAIRYIDNPVDEPHPRTVDPLGSDRARLNTLNDNLQYLQGLQDKPRYRGDKDLAGRIANIQGQIRGIYINNGQQPPHGLNAANDAARDSMRDSMNTSRSNLLGGSGSQIHNVAPVQVPRHKD